MKNQKIPYQYRQGDVLVRKINTPPSELPATMARDERGRIILAAGEVTGHHHAISDTDIEAYEKDGVIYLRIVGDTEGLANLKHEEHGTIPIPRVNGFYESRVKCSYDPLGISRVRD